MGFVTTALENNIAVVTINRGKVNALNLQILKELNDCLVELLNKENVKSVVLTGQNKFFSYGFDIPDLYSLSKDEYTAFLKVFTKLCLDMFLYPKPLIACLNGHTVAGGCLLALTCDYRMIAEGRSKVGLNELNLGASIFSSSVEMLRFIVGDKNAEMVLITGKMFSVDEAKQIGLVDEAVPENMLLETAKKKAFEYAEKSLPAFTTIKHLLRKQILDKIKDTEEISIKDFVEIWYSPKMRASLKEVKIS